MKLINVTSSAQLLSNTVLASFWVSVDAYLIRTLSANTNKLKRLELAENFFLGNANQAYALTAQPNIGNLRETFFLSQLAQQHQITSPKNTDFCIDKRMYFEIGGKNKNAKQTLGLENSYLALDDIEHGTGKCIPLWLFGFLY
jgi:hypothetical protein